jgi:hypothetical protein
LLVLALECKWASASRWWGEWDGVWLLK